MSDGEDVRHWRIREAMRITGCTLREARKFAESDGDLHVLERVAKQIAAKGGDVKFALRVV